MGLLYATQILSFTVHFRYVCKDIYIIGYTKINLIFFKIIFVCLQSLLLTPKITTLYIKNINDVSELALRGDIEGFDAQNIANEISNVKGKMIRIRINSGGGFVIWAYTIISAMQIFKNEGGIIETINEGRADSAAGWIFACGSKGRRFIMQFAKMFFHPPMYQDGTTIEQLPDGSDERNLLENNFTDLISIFEGCTGLSDSRIRNIMKDNTEMSANEAVSLSFADKIVEISNLKEIRENLTARQLITNVSTYEIQEVENQIHTDMKEIAKKLGLNPEASESAILSELDNVLNFRDEATGEITELKSKVLEITDKKISLETEISNFKNAEALEFVNKNYPGKTALEKEAIVNLFKADSETFKGLISGTPAHAEIDKDVKEAESKDVKNEVTKDAAEFAGLTHGQRNELKNLDPNKYGRLMNAYESE